MSSSFSYEKLKSKKIFGISLATVLMISAASGLAITGTIGAAALAGSLGIGVGVCSVGAISGDGCVGQFSETELSDGTIEEIHRSIYSSALFADDYADNMETEITSYANQSYGVSMANAKLVGVEAHNEGLERTEAHDEISDVVNGHYAAYQKSIVEDRNRKALQIDRIAQRVDETDGLDEEDVYHIRNYDGATAEGDMAYTRYEFLDEGTFELVNGTEIDYYAPRFKYTTCGTCNDENRTIFTDHLDKDSSNTYAIDEFRVYDSNQEEIAVVSAKQFKRTWGEVETHRQRSLDNIFEVIDDIYANYDEGELDVSDAMSPIELLQTSATNYDDTGYYAYYAASMEYMGLATDRDYAFEVTYDNEGQDEVTRFGQLFTGEDETLETGVEYDASEGSYVFIQDNEDGSAERVDLDGTFTIESMIDGETGEEVNETTTQSTNFYTESTEELAEQIEELNELQDDIGAISSALGEIAGFLDNFSDLDQMLGEYSLYVLVIGLLAVGAIIL